MLAGFLRLGSSSALISYDTTDFHIEGKEGSWLAYDSIIIEGREFFLMEHSVYGAQAANVMICFFMSLIFMFVLSYRRIAAHGSCKGAIFFLILQAQTIKR